MTAKGHGAMNVLAFPEHENLSVLHNDLNERAYMLFNGVITGDYSMFRGELGGDERAEKFKRAIETRLEEHRTDTGKLRNLNVAGTLPGTEEGEVITTVILKGEAGGTLGFRLHWVDGELERMSPAGGAEPVSMRLAPLSPTRFAGYHPGWGKSITIDFEVDRHSSVRTLTIPTGGEDILATRR